MKLIHDTKTAEATPTHPPIAVIGIGCLFPRAFGAKEFWRLLFNGEDAISDVPDTHWSAADYFNPNPKTPDHTYCRRGGFLAPLSYDPSEFGIPPNCLEATDTSQLLALSVAKQALEDAGYGDKRTFDRRRTSVILGVTGTQELVIPLGARLGHPIWKKALEDAGISEAKANDVMQNIAEGYVSWQENSFPGLLGNVVAGRIANRLNLGGTNCVVDAACASSLSAVNLAMLELITGRADMVITGGVDTLNDIFMHMCFSQTGVLSFTGDAKPFSQEADGTVLGEGIGMVVLKRLADAQKDNDTIYCVIKGIGTSSDGKSGSIYAPNAAGQENALQMAYASSGIAPETIELIEAHGTGTRVGDAVEFKALRNVFETEKTRPAQCALGSVKSMIGHTKAAAGAAGLIKAALALHHKVIPPTLKADVPDEQLDIDDSPFYLTNRSRPWLPAQGHPRRSGVSAFGFGGSNFHVILEEYTPQKQTPSWDASVEIAAISASDPKTLRKRLRTLKQCIAEIPEDRNRHYAAVAFHAAQTRQRFSPADAYRLLLTIERPDYSSDDYHTHFSQLFEAADALLDKDPPQIGTGEQIFYGGPAKPGQLAFLFPGQGSQYVGMGRDLAGVFPAAHTLFTKADSAFTNTHASPARPLGSYLYPLTPASATDANVQAALRQTNVAQPAIGAVSALMRSILDDFAITPDAVCGHSFGELTALYAAGGIDDETFFSLAATRGSLMSQTDEDAGTMLAVSAPIAEIEAVAETVGPEVVLANRNSPRQGVLSGSHSAIQSCETLCRERGLRSTRLPVSGAFHSPHVANAAKRFAAEISNAPVTATKLAVFSNTIATPYPEDPDGIKELLGRHMRQPVNFMNNIENMYAAGIRTFVEVGPKTVLTSLVKSILPHPDVCAIALDRSSGKKSGIADLAKMICQLGALGYPVDVTRWETAPVEPHKQKMRIPISGANYRGPRKDAIRKKPVETHEPPARAPRVAPASANTAPLPYRQTTAAKPTPSPAPEIQSGKKVPTVSANPSKNTIPKNTMNSSQQPQQNSFIRKALQVVQDGLKSIQDLQTRTANAHTKFLEHQTIAGQTMQRMIERTQHITEAMLDAVPQAFTKTDTDTTPPPLSHTLKQALPDIPAPVPDIPLTDMKTHTKPVSELPSPLPEKETASPDTEPAVERNVRENVTSIILDIICQLTGYPTDMLDMEMEIEADLGIDSIKRVEILSTLEERLPDLGSVSPETLGEMKTLAQIRDYIVACRPQTSSTAVTSDTTDAHLSSNDSDDNDSNRHAIHDALMQIVCNLTGYPIDMLDLTMEIEADLGIDSIKRVEILSSLEEQLPDLPPLSPDILSDIKTLGQIIDYLSDVCASEGGTGRTQKTAASAQAIPGGQQRGEIEKTLMAIIHQLTGYPIDMLDPEMEIEADLGIDSIKRVEILSLLEEQLSNLPPLSADVMTELKTLRQISDYLAQEFASRTTRPKNDVPVNAAYSDVKDTPQRKTGHDDVTRHVIKMTASPLPVASKLSLPSDKTVYVTKDNSGLGQAIADLFSDQKIHTRLIDLTAVPDTLDYACGLIVVADCHSTDSNQNTWYESDEAYVKQGFDLISRTGRDLVAAAEAGGAVLATITRLDGRLGFSGAPIARPITGGLSGITKTAALEFKGVNCHAIDVSPAWQDTQTIAETILAEICSQPEQDSIEKGFDIIDGKPVRYIPELVTQPFSAKKLPLNREDVVVISGGARGVTAACAFELARQYQPAIVLLGRSPEPTPEPDWLIGLDDQGTIKKAILKHEFPQKPGSPAELEKVYRGHMANREILQTLEKIKSTGAAVHYYPVDIRDNAAVRSVLENVRTSMGSISAIIHGAGVVIDRFIIDKTPAQFTAVFDTKVKGLQALLKATAEDALKYLIFFSSVSARQGNTGQADYAAANEALNKIAQKEAVLRPDCRVTAINWGPWDGGMVSPSLKKEFLRQNITLIPIEKGAQSMLAEMSDDSTSVEVVIGAGFPHASAHKTKVPEPATQKQPPAAQHHLSMLIKRDIDVASHPVLSSHQLNGIPVVPMALIAEWLGHSALHENPGFCLHGIDNLRVLAGIKVDNGARKIQLLAGKAKKNGTYFKVDVAIGNGAQNNGDITHSSATVILANTLSPAPEYKIPKDLARMPYSRTMTDIYENILFHGKDLQGIKEVVGYSENGMITKTIGAPAPDKWIVNPLRSRWLTDPLILDCAFQTAVLWCYENTGHVALPSYYRIYRQYTTAFPSEEVTIVFELREQSSHKIKGDFTFLDAQNRVIAHIEGSESILDPALIKAFKPALYN